MNNRYVALGLGILALLFALGYAYTNWNSDYSDDPDVAIIEKERDKEFAEPDSMSEDQMKDAGDRLRKMADGLNDEQKKELWESSASLFMPMIMKRQEKEWDTFLALSPDDQRTEMDKRIDQQVAFEKMRDKQGPKGGPQFSPKQADEFMKKMNDWTTPEQRAKFQTIITMYNDRRKERGLDPISWGPR